MTPVGMQWKFYTGVISTDVLRTPSLNIIILLLMYCNVPAPNQTKLGFMKGVRPFTSELRDSRFREQTNKLIC
jgi:hypothetical protein